MAVLYFFTDKDKFSQLESSAYGPVSGNQTTQFNLCGNFELTTVSNAYAAFDGFVFVQPVSGFENDLVNILLFNPNNESLVPVKFVVYRGIRRDSIIKNGEIIGLDDADKTDLTTLIQRTFAAHQADRKPIPQEQEEKVSLDSIGFNFNSLDDFELVDKVFTENNHLEFVEAGSIIGRFSNVTGHKKGFEVFLEDKHFKYTLGTLRSLNNILTVENPDVTEDPGNQPINKMRAREVILNFMDPAAFYSIHINEGIKYRESSGLTFIVNNIIEGYDGLLKKFFTCNRLYIDIRNQEGYSLNYYKDYQGEPNDSDFGSHFDLKVNGFDLGRFNYYVNYWPIFMYQIVPDVSDAGNVIELSFRKKNNPVPLLYVDYGSRSEDFPQIAVGKRKFLSIEPSITDWTDFYSFTVPNVTGSVNAPAVSFIKIQYLRPILPEEPLPNSVIQLNEYTFPVIEEIANTTVKFPVIWKIGLGDRYVEMGEGIAGIASISATFDYNTVSYFGSLKEWVPAFEYHYSMSPLEITSPIYSSKNFYEIAADNTTTTTGGFRKVPLENSNVALPVWYRENPIKSIYGITISKVEHDFILALAGANQDFHNRVLHIKGIKSGIDKNNKSYYVGHLFLVGLDNDGKYFEATTKIDVYSLDGTWFNSLSVGKYLNLKPLDKVYLSVKDFEDSIKEAEKVYCDGPLFSDKPDELVTRIRAHQFGYPGRPSYGTKYTAGNEGAVGFNYAVPNAPYYELNPHIYKHVRGCSGEGIAPKLMDKNAIDCRIKHLYKKDGIDLRAYNNLTGEEVDGEVVLIDPKGNIIDYGHAIYGLCCLRHQGFNGATHRFYKDNFQIDFAVDFTSFIGDLASSIGQAYLRYENPTLTHLDRLFLDYTSSKDIIGDVEMFGWNECWENMDIYQLGFRLSDVIKNYYSESYVVNYKSRWKIFCEKFKLIEYVGGAEDDGYIWNFDQIYYGSGLSSYEMLKQRLIRFTKLYHNFKCRGLDVSGEIATGLYSYPMKVPFNITEELVVDPYHYNYVLDKFLQIVRSSLNDEQKWSL